MVGITYTTRKMSTFHLCLVLVAVLIHGIEFASAADTCSPPGDVQNGGYTPRVKVYHIGESADYFCNSGYILEGVSWIKCMYQEGKEAGWAHPPPICKLARKYLIPAEGRGC